MIDLVCPAGIGDVAWVISRLWPVRDQIGTIHIVDGKPRRTVPFVELAGFESDYWPIGYNDIQLFEQTHGLRHWQEPTWDKVTKVVAGTIHLECNEHMEAGKRLETWLPDLPPPNHHFPLNTTPENAERAARYLAREMKKHPMTEGPILMWNAASVQGAKNWDAWLLLEWKLFLQKTMDDLGYRPLAVGGDWDDLTYAICCDLDLPDLVGKTDLGTLIELLKLAPAYIGFSSGLNVIRTILNKPAMALWPSHQNDLRNSWAPPEMLESRRYVSSLYHPLDYVWAVARRFLNQCSHEAALANSGNGILDSPPQLEGVSDEQATTSGGKGEL